MLHNTAVSCETLPHVVFPFFSQKIERENIPMPTQEKEKLPRGYLVPRSLVDEARDLGTRLPERRQGVQCAFLWEPVSLSSWEIPKVSTRKRVFFTIYKQSVHECSIQFFIPLLTFQATLQRLEGMLEMPSQQEFMQMTSVRNGGDHVNGHGNVQGW